jgi:hypothetical protein
MDAGFVTSMKLPPTLEPSKIRPTVMGIRLGIEGPSRALAPITANLSSSISSRSLCEGASTLKVRLADLQQLSQGRPPSGKQMIATFRFDRPSSWKSLNVDSVPCPSPALDGAMCVHPMAYNIDRQML